MTAGHIKGTASRAHARAREAVGSDSPNAPACHCATADDRHRHDPVPGNRFAQLARSLAIAPITLYRGLISPAIPRRCKYEPTCSRYAVEAIARYGVLRGIVLAGWRLLRCNPFSYGGYDPVEAQRVFEVDHDARRP